MKLDSPDACARTFAERLSKGDLDGGSAIFDEATVFVREDGRIVRGRDAIRKIVAPFVTGKAKATVEIRRVIPVGDDLAVVYHEWCSEIPEPGNGIVPNAGAGVQVLRRRSDGSWCIVFDDPSLTSRED